MIFLFPLWKDGKGQETRNTTVNCTLSFLVDTVEYFLDIYLLSTWLT